MDKFQPGVVCFHKASRQRCVVIKTMNDMVKVRDEKLEEHDFYPQELETEAERDTKREAVARSLNQLSDDIGFGY